MANTRAFLDTNGLIHYNNELLQALNQSDFKKGLISKSDLPCYTSSLREVYNKNTAVFFDYAGSNAADFEFLQTLFQENNLCSFTIILDGEVYENVGMYNSGSGDHEVWRLSVPDPDNPEGGDSAYLFKIEYTSYSYSMFSTKAENVDEWNPRTDEKRGEITHNLKIYVQDLGSEYVHKLDHKYLHTSEGISGSDSGIVLGSQVYTYVNNQVAVMQTVLDNVESILVTL